MAIARGVRLHETDAAVGRILLLRGRIVAPRGDGPRHAREVGLPARISQERVAVEGVRRVVDAFEAAPGDRVGCREKSRIRGTRPRRRSLELCDLPPLLRHERCFLLRSLLIAGTVE